MTRSTPGSRDSFSWSMCSALPSAPRMVVSAPLDTMTLTPPSSMVCTAASNYSGVNSRFIMTTIF